MKPIGGFFELELPGTYYSYHPDSIALSTGRACLRLMLKNLKISKCYVPFYTCNAVLDPFIQELIPVEEYRIDNQFNPVNLPVLKKDEYIIYINYFGIKSKTADWLIAHYQDKVIIDNTHSFFHKGYSNNWSLTSARKHFGVPDGAYLHNPIPIPYKFERFANISLQHHVLRLLGNQELSYKEYLKYEKTLNAEINLISIISEKLLSGIDYDYVKIKRTENFWFLHEHLKEYNEVLINSEMTDIPFAYPFLPDKAVNKNGFYERGFYIPSLWTDPLSRVKDGFEQEVQIVQRLLPLPIDHRYSTRDMEQIIRYIKEII